MIVNQGPESYPHACPACNCHLGQYAIEGFEHMEGLTNKVIRLSAQLRQAHLALARKQRR